MSYTVILHGLRKRKVPLTLIISVLILCAIGCITLVGPWVAPHNPDDFITDKLFSSPSVGLLLGSDYLGRDLFSRIVSSAPVTIGMALAATLIAHLFGDSLGLYSAIKGGVIDATLCRIADVILALPKIVIGLVVLAALGPSIPVIVAISAVVYGAGVFRLARSLGADIVKLDYVVVARARGERAGWVISREILPHVTTPLAADFAVRMGFSVLFMSSLSFLGLGVQPPMTDWGALVRENLDGLSAGSFAAIFPALAIALTTVSLNLLVDSLSERTS